MINIKELVKALKQVSDEKGLAPEKVLGAVEDSIAAAYKKEYRERGEIVRCKLNTKTGELEFSKVMTVVDETTVRFVEEGSEEDLQDKDKKGQRESRYRNVEPDNGEPKLPRFNPERHMLLSDAKKEKKGVELGEELAFPLEVHDDFGRIAAQTAKQVVLQKLRESERDSILAEWRDKADQIVSGVVQRFERGHVYIDMPALEALYHAAYYLVCFITPLRQDRVALGLAQLLEHNLFCSLCCNAAEVVMHFKRESQLLAKFNSFLLFFCVRKKHVPLGIKARKFWLAVVWLDVSISRFTLPLLVFIL